MASDVDHGYYSLYMTVSLSLSPSLSRLMMMMMMMVADYGAAI